MSIQISFDDLVTATTEDQFVERFLSSLETLGIRARSWRAGGVYRTILRIVAATCAAFSTLQVQFIRSAFLELAAGVWLTWVAFYVYGVERPEATFATGKINVTNDGGGLYNFNIGALRVFNTATKKSYTNQNAFTLNPLETVNDVDIIAVEIGSDSSSAAGQIDKVETQYEGQITVTNPLPVVGADQLPDEDTRQLCRDKLAARSVFGPRGAYAYAVRSARRVNGTLVDINRVSISPSSSTGVVTIVVASPSGVPTTDDLDAVKTNIEEVARPDTVTANTSAATTHAIARTLTIWAKKQNGLTANDLKALALKQIVDLQRSAPIGGWRKGGLQGYFYADRLDAAIQAAHPTIYSIDGSGADVLLTSSEVPTLAVTIDQVRIVDDEVH